jgi:transposase-like protein
MDAEHDELGDELPLRARVLLAAQLQALRVYREYLARATSEGNRCLDRILELYLLAYQVNCPKCGESEDIAPRRGVFGFANFRCKSCGAMFNEAEA